MTHVDLLKSKQTWAVLGMSDNPEKFAYKIFHALKDHGKTVYGVNSKYDQIDGEKIYPDFNSFPTDVDVAVFVVNPIIGLGYLQQLQDNHITNLWLQPGTVSEELVEQAKSRGFNIIENCVLAAYSLMGQE